MSIPQPVEQIEIGQHVSWKNRGRYHEGIVRAIVEPGENVLRKFPHLMFTSEARAQFQIVSSVQRVLVEEPRDGRGGRHYSRYFAPLVGQVMKCHSLIDAEIARTRAAAVQARVELNEPDEDYPAECDGCLSLVEKHEARPAIFHAK